MAAEPGAPVVVGVDGSMSSYAAVDWGVCEAQRRTAPLRLVHVVGRSDGSATTGSAPLGSAPGRAAVRARRVAATDEITDRAEAYAHACVSDVAVTAEVLVGEPAGRLADESARAAVVAVGDHGLHGLRSLLAGSVPIRLTAAVRCPLVVVRPHVAPLADDLDPHHGVGRVVVGVDGSALGEAALDFAFEEAELRGVGLTAVHAWRFPVAAGTGDMLFAVYERVDLADGDQRLLTEVLAPFRERYPGVPVRPVSVQAVSPAAALIHESGGAELLVVGSSGRGGLAALLLGSVSHAAIHHAFCPVAVIHR
ncbi:universal stress protein [Planosporangium flavigriseum]|uniref:UspA domain-containing protein n=1 Tax=Planosporangium flavigriseum TaxID=373681 RepID=A0A8J3PN60_9ACTN|nr:universal stress protein [Planosporangium flavigriseum]NJC65968.1 universal stress protein [Planosporangium flavigriseum]GIG74568.1 hypothetical protein Pfl04_29720 [Planosporangium flavigriseum]